MPNERREEMLSLRANCEARDRLLILGLTDEVAQSGSQPHHSFARPGGRPFDGRIIAEKSDQGARWETTEKIVCRRRSFGGLGDRENSRKGYSIHPV